jgi:hypothetical protein
MAEIFPDLVAFITLGFVFHTAPSISKLLPVCRTTLGDVVASLSSGANTSAIDRVAESMAKRDSVDMWVIITS